jgi:hypothetical protein
VERLQTPTSAGSSPLNERENSCNWDTAEDVVREEVAKTIDVLSHLMLLEPCGFAEKMLRHERSH